MTLLQWQQQQMSVKETGTARSRRTKCPSERYGRGIGERRTLHTPRRQSNGSCEREATKRPALAHTLPTASTRQYVVSFLDSRLQSYD